MTTPHRCPVCDGTGSSTHRPSPRVTNTNVPCCACGGSCIVWSPPIQPLSPELAKLTDLSRPGPDVIIRTPKPKWYPMGDLWVRAACSWVALRRRSRKPAGTGELPEPPAIGYLSGDGSLRTEGGALDLREFDGWAPIPEDRP